MTFTAVPPVPQQSELTDWEIRFLTALKQNVELLTGQRNAEAGFAALLRGQFSVAGLGAMGLQQITATGASVVISGSTVPLTSDYVKLINDVATLASDVAEVRAAFSILAAQIAAGS